MSFQALDPEDDRQEQLKRASEAASLDVAPRFKRSAQEFETNPQQQSFEEEQAVDWSTQSESARIREAVRRLVQENQFINPVARDLNLSPASILRWEQNYRSFLAQQNQAHSAESWETNTQWSGNDAIPQEWKSHFAQNWENLVEATHAAEADFRQDPLEIFLHQSWLTSWLFRDGRLDKNVAMGAIIALSLGVAVFSFMNSRHGRDLMQGSSRTLSKTQEEIDKEEIAQAIVVARQYFEATSWEKKLGFIHQPEKMRASVQEWFTKNYDGAHQESEIQLATHEPGLVHLLVNFKKSHVPVAFIALVKENDRYYIDWESSSNYQGTEWAKIKEKRSSQNQPLMCVVKKADYFNYHFQNPEQWHCYELSYPNGDIILYGYAPINSPADITLSSQLIFSDYTGVIMNISYPEGALTDNQVHIHDIVRIGWLSNEPSETPKKNQTSSVQ
jgi:hypothetical protein